MYLYVCMYVYVYIYIYIERERERYTYIIIMFLRGRCGGFAENCIALWPHAAKLGALEI